MIIQIQQTSALILGLVILLVWLDGRSNYEMPKWYENAIVYTIAASVTVLIITTLARIWL